MRINSSNQGNAENNIQKLKLRCHCEEAQRADVAISATFPTSYRRLPRQCAHWLAMTCVLGDMFNNTINYNLQKKEAVLADSLNWFAVNYLTATHSISTRAFLGRQATWNAARAG